MSDTDSVKVIIEGDENRPSAPERSLDEINAEIERSHAETARNRALAAQYRAENAHNRVVSALHQAESEGFQAQTEYRNAVEVGDTEAQALAQARMTEVELRKVRLRDHDEALQNMPLPPSDPVEAACVGLTPTSAAWLRRHPNQARDTSKLAKLRAAHFDAESEGLVPDTREYFDHIERRVGIRDRAPSKTGDTIRRGPVPAGVNPGDPNTHVNGNEVFLTKGESQRATDGTLVWNYGPNKGRPIGLGEMARRKAAMHAEGRYQTME
jgi:hypothetical protein